MAAPEPGRRVGPVALDQVLRKDLRSVTPHGLRVDEAIEREILEILQQAVLTPATLERLLTEVNIRLRAQATVSRPRIKGLRRALTLVDREVANYTRAIAKGDFSSLEQALSAAEQRRATLQAELAQLDGNQQPAVIQLTPAALERHLQGMTEKLRSGVNGKVREAIQASIARILVDVDGSLTIEAKSSGLLGLDDRVGHLPGKGPGRLIEFNGFSGSHRQWGIFGI
ncbi:MAG: hypothetical protein ABSD47_16020 [Candidatus Methylomirabilota bacterium]